MAKAQPKTAPRVADPILLSLFDVQEATLPNGLRVRLLANPQTPVVSLYTFFQVGSRNERPGITGISHLFEHMMFNGAKKYGPKKFDQVLESNGGRSNAYTSTDMTVYYEDFASDALETVLDLESDRMRSLRINDAALTSERQVVMEERRVRVDNDISGLMDEELGSLAAVGARVQVLYTQDHLAPGGARREPCHQRGEGVAQVHPARGRRREPPPHYSSCSYT